MTQINEWAITQKQMNEWMTKETCTYKETENELFTTKWMNQWMNEHIEVDGWMHE